MPRRGRTGPGRVAKRKRQSRKYGKKKSVKKPKLTAHKIFQALMPTRKLIWDCIQNIQSSQNSRRWVVLPALSDETRMMTALTSVGAEQLDKDITGVALSAIVNFDNYTSVKCRMYMTIQNVSNHPCIVDVFTCICREDIVNSNFSDIAGPPLVTAFQQHANFRYVWGLDKQAAGPQIGVGAGTLINYTIASNTFEDLGEFSPYMSEEFVKEFKILSKQQVTLNPQQTYKGKLSAKTHKYSYEDSIGPASLQTKLAHGGVTKFVLIGIRGILGKSNADDAIVGYMTADVAVNQKFIYDVVPHTVAKKSIATRLTDRPTLGMAVLEGPTTFQMFNENG